MIQPFLEICCILQEYTVYIISAEFLVCHSVILQILSILFVISLNGHRKYSKLKKNAIDGIPAQIISFW